SAAVRREVRQGAGRTDTQPGPAGLAPLGGRLGLVQHLGGLLGQQRGRIRSAPHGHAHGEDVDHQQVQDAADHGHVRVDVLHVVHDQRHISFPGQR
ncbi:MAG: hypothetical protein ACK559_17895, partial [bacterium]